MQILIADLSKRCNTFSLEFYSSKLYFIQDFQFCLSKFHQWLINDGLSVRCVMCHKSPCHIKNNVPHIYRRYSVKKFSRLVSSKSAELTSKILSCVGQSCLYNCSCSSRSLPSQERIFEVNSADFEDTNLENFFR